VLASDKEAPTMNVAAYKVPRRFPEMPGHWQQFALCLLFHLLVPCIPLGIEWVVLGHVENKTLLLFVAVYPLSIGVSSRSSLMFGITVIVGLVYSIFFGLISGNVLLNPNVYKVGAKCLAGLVLIHAGERYNRHVVDGESFWEFG
jgi:hypothetical protein